MLKREMYDYSKQTGSPYCDFVLLAALLMSAACSTTRSDGTEPEAATTASDSEENYLTSADIKGDPDRIICRRERPTGSRISEKVCMTARQWQKQTDAAQRVLDTVTRAPQQGNDQ